MAYLFKGEKILSLGEEKMLEILDSIGYARTTLKDYLKVEEGEGVLIITDSDKVKVAETFACAASTLNAEPVLSIMKPRSVDGEEPPKPVAKAMKGADVIIIPTSKSLTHTDATEEACEEGGRVASMPGITKGILRAEMKTDIGELKNLTLQLARKLSEASRVAIRTKKGTNLSLSLEGREGVPNTGLIEEKGSYGNLPAGEAFIAPREGKAEGRVVFDLTLSELGALTEDIRVEIEDGRIKEIEGGSEGRKFKERLEEGDENSDIVAELGLGTNMGAKIMGNTLIDEKVGGTAHIAFGDNSHFGGEIESKSHLDGVFSEPTVILDGEAVVEEGEIVGS